MMEYSHRVFDAGVPPFETGGGGNITEYYEVKVGRKTEAGVELVFNRKEQKMKW